MLELESLKPMDRFLVERLGEFHESRDLLRYDYLYSNAELSEWALKIQEMAKKAEKVYVFFNNCHAGQAAKNAALMQSMLLGDG